MSLIQNLAILDQVSNTEGVSYQVFLVVIGTMLTIFVTTVGILMNIINTRAIRMEDKQDKATEKINDLQSSINDLKQLIIASSNSNILNFASLKEKLGIQQLPSDILEDNKPKE
jgi:hypothetical protein